MDHSERTEPASGAAASPAAVRAGAASEVEANRSEARSLDRTLLCPPAARRPPSGSSMPRTAVTFCAARSAGSGAPMPAASTRKATTRRIISPAAMPTATPTTSAPSRSCGGSLPARSISSAGSGRPGACSMSAAPTAFSCRRPGASSTCSGIELAEDAAEHCRQTRPAACSRASPTRANLARLGAMDVIVLLDVIEHLPSPARHAGAVRTASRSWRHHRDHDRRLRIALPPGLPVRAGG